ncbi:MAG: hypothetical protein ICV75_07770, partial [Nitrospiraceae bacterium]|nr:hypothetical protein [Nitrospiraceae bacterium]
QLRQQLDAANHALAVAQSPERIEALTAERQQVLNQMQAHALVSQVWTESIYAPVLYAYPGIAFRHANGLLLQARQLHPANPHLHAAQQALTARAGAFPPPPGESIPVPPRTSLLVPQVPDGTYPREAAQLQQGLPSPSPLAAPFLKPTFPQIQPQGVPHGSLHQTPLPPTFPQNELHGMPRGSFPQTAVPTFPQIQPFSVPHGSFPQGTATPTFPQIQPQGVPHGSLHQTPAPSQPGSGAAERFSGTGRR